MTKNFVHEKYAKPPRKFYPTSELVYNYIDEIWSFDLAVMIDYKNSIIKGYRYIFIIIDTFSKNLWAILLKKYSDNNR